MPTFVQPELWVDKGASAVEFYRAAFGATVLLQVGDGEDIVAQLAVDGAAFWVAATTSAAPRFTPHGIGGATGRTLLVVDDPDAVAARAVAAGAVEASAVADEHGWRVGRIIDPFGHEWEIGRPPHIGPALDMARPRPDSADAVRTEGGLNLTVASALGSSVVRPPERKQAHAVRVGRFVG